MKKNKTLDTILKEDMERLEEINKINDEFIKNMKGKEELSGKEIETLDKVAATMIRRAAMIGKMQQDMLDREEAKIRQKKMAEGNKLEIKLNI